MTFSVPSQVSSTRPAEAFYGTPVPRPACRPRAVSVGSRPHHLDRPVPGPDALSPCHHTLAGGHGPIRISIRPSILDGPTTSLVQAPTRPVRARRRTPQRPSRPGGAIHPVHLRPDRPIRSFVLPGLALEDCSPPAGMVFPSLLATGSASSIRYVAHLAGRVGITQVKSLRIYKVFIMSETVQRRPGASFRRQDASSSESPRTPATVAATPASRSPSVRVWPLGPDTATPRPGLVGGHVEGDHDVHILDHESCVTMGVRSSAYPDAAADDRPRRRPILRPWLNPCAAIPLDLRGGRPWGWRRIRATPA